MKTFTRYHLILAGLALAALGILSYGMVLHAAFSGPPCSSGGNCSGAIGVDAGNDVSLGTSTPISSARVYIVGSSTSANSYALRVDSLAGTPLLLVRNDGRVDIATSTFSTNGALRVVGQIETASTTGIPGGIVFPDGSIQTTAVTSSGIAAGNVSPGTFGSIVGVGNYAFPAALTVSSTLTVGTTTAPAAGVSFFNGRVGIGTNNPTSTLDVSGGAIIVRNSTAPRDAIASSTRLQATAPTSDFIIAVQDGSGAKVAQYWNAKPGASPTYLVGSENAARIFFGTSDNTNLFQLSYASGVGKSAGNAITWTNVFTVATSGLVTASGRITGVSTPTASNDAATKGYVDGVNVGVRWAGYTTTTYTGLIGGGSGGVKNGGVLCNSNYAGSHWAQQTEIIALGSNYPWSQIAWTANGSDCSNWGSNSISLTGNIANTTQFTTDTCNTSHYLACVY